jgi:hypothetical protein
MTSEKYTEDDQAQAPPGTLLLSGCDVEVNASVHGDDIVVRVNKGGILIGRVRLQDAATEMTGERLMAFSTFAPDFAFKIGDSRDGMERLKRSLGVA